MLLPHIAKYVFKTDVNNLNKFGQIQVYDFHKNSSGKLSLVSKATMYSIEYVLLKYYYAPLKY